MKLDSILQKFGRGTGASPRAESFAPIIFESPAKVPYGSFHFEFTITPGLDYDIQASPDLQNWNSLTRNVAKTQTVKFLDSHAQDYNTRFYRIISGEIHSLNVIGFVSINLPPGFSLIANPLDTPACTVGEMFKTWPDGTMLNKFDTQLFRLTDNSVKLGKWTNPAERLTPGEGAIFFNPTTDYETHSFVGEVKQGKHSMPIPSGFSIRSSMTPKTGRLLEDMEFPVTEGDVIHLFDRDSQKYVLYPFGANGWEAGAPILTAGEAFWVAKTSPENWTRELFLGL